MIERLIGAEGAGWASLSPATRNTTRHSGPSEKRTPTSKMRPMNKPPIKRFQWFSYERAPVGTFGPFGPIEAHDAAEARRIAAARAARSGLHLDRVEPQKEKK